MPLAGRVPLFALTLSFGLLFVWHAAYWLAAAAVAVVLTFTAVRPGATRPR
jgi:hypothetical protein